jgi:2-polyprenyl-3-methyl-5-hydroxy-6-metoxy-1,4-benzoquinol methylase
VLELGCGLGTESVNFARHGAELTVVELSQTSLDLARQRFEVYGLHADFHQANAEELDQVRIYLVIYIYLYIHHGY